MTSIKQFAIALFCLMTFGLGAQLASAQGAEQAQPGAMAEHEVSDSHLALYIQAATRVEEIRQDVQQQMGQAESTEQAQAMQEEAMQEMVNAVQSFGMTVDEYNQIAAAVQQSPELQQRLQELL